MCSKYAKSNFKQKTRRIFHFPVKIVLLSKNRIFHLEQHFTQERHFKQIEKHFKQK